MDELEELEDASTDHNRVKNPYALLKLVVLLLLVGGGTYLLAQANQVRPTQIAPWGALGVAAIGTAALFVRLRAGATAENAPAWLQKAISIIANNWRIVLFIIAQWSIIYVLWRIPQLDPRADDYTPLVPFWIGAFLLFLWAVWGKSSVADTAAPITRQTWWLIGGIVAAAFLLRVWQLGTIPFTFSGDEAEQGLEALRVINGQTRNPFHTGWLGVPSLSFYFNSLSVRAFGRTVFGLRFPWAIVGSLTVLLTFLWVRRLQNNTLALIAAALVAAYHYHIHFSRLGSNQIADPFFLALSLWLLYRALQRQNKLDWALTGGAMGIAFYFYAGARLTPVVVIATIAYLFICQPRAFRRQHGFGVLVMIAGFLFVAAPMLQYAWLNPGEFNARLNQVGIFQSGWYDGVRESGRTPLQIFSKQFAEAALAFNYYPDKTIWYGLKEPLLTPLYGILFLIGLLYATVQVFRFKSYALAAPVAWWWGGMLSAGFLTVDPPNSQRLITLAIPVCIFIALMLHKVITLLQTGLTDTKMLRRGFLVAAVGLFAFSSVRLYFVEFSPQRISGGGRALFATEIATPLNQLVPTYKAYFVGAPWMYWGFGTTKYLVGEEYGIDMGIDPVSADLFDQLVDPAQPAVFVVLGERINELETIMAAYPNGHKQEIRAADGRLYGVIYAENR